MSYLVFDLETVPDSTLGPYGPDPVTGKDRFAPPPYHEIVALGYAWLRDNLTVERMGVLSGDEAKLLTQFTSRIAEKHPTVCGVNTRGFDFPVIVARCLKHGVPFPYYYDTRDMRYRFSAAAHLDIQDFLSDYGAAPKASLDAWSKLIGWPGKRDVKGSDVAGMIEAGNQAGVESYCLEDVANTTAVLLRVELVRGSIGRAQYDAASRALIQVCSADPRLQDMMAAINVAQFEMRTAA